MLIGAIDFKNILISIADTIDPNVSYLTDLDAEIGDGDHGINMQKGFTKIRDTLLSSSIKDIGELLIVSGNVLLNEIGGAMGPLYGGGLVYAGKKLKGKVEIDKFDIYTIFSSMLESMNSIAPAKIGDKTLVDTLEPFVNEYKSLVDNNNLLSIFEKSMIKAKQGMESTKDIISRVGRSSSLRERSIGHLDVGAVSCYLILEAFYKYLLKIKNQ